MNSYAEVIAELIRQGIREGLLDPGTPLIQDDLARRFGVSRVPVREALRIVAAEGLVTIRRGGGAAVISLRSEEVAELYDLRLLVEPGLSAFIVERVSRDDISRLKMLVAKMEEVASVIGDQEIALWGRANFSFHRTLYEIAGRPYTVDIVESLLTRVQPYSLISVFRLGNLEQASHDHMGMINACESNDPVELERLIKSHLMSAKQRLVDWFNCNTV